MRNHKLGIALWLIIGLFSIGMLFNLVGCGQSTTTDTSSTIPPAVLTTSPTNGATGVAPNTTISATFNKSMDDSTLHTATFRISSTEGRVIGRSVSYDASSRTATYTPYYNLVPATTYTATISASVKDSAGNQMGIPYTWSFTTTPLSVLSVSPTNGATGINVTTEVSVVFSENIDSTSINTSTFTVSSSLGAVSGAVNYNATSKTATFVPSSSLSYSTTYTATIAASVKDAAGNQMGTPYTWSFTTRNIWLPQVSDTTSNLLDVQFINSNTGWIVGAQGTILKTADGGSTWVTQTSGTSEVLYDVHLIDSNTGWISGSGGTILKTTNGGATWVAQTSGTSTLLFGIYFIDQNTGWAVGYSGVIRKTTNGGNSWVAQTSGTSDMLYDVYFVDQNTGWAVGGSSQVNGTILKTTNGGNSWVAQTSGISNILNRAQFINSDIGWAVELHGKIIKTVNGGNDWSFQTDTTSHSMMDIFFIDQNIGWAVGLYEILKTTDGGDNWNLQQSLYYDLGAVYFVDSNTGWAVGDRGVIIKYSP